jgi:predicted nucleic acid-binding protein
MADEELTFPRAVVDTSCLATSGHRRRLVDAARADAYEGIISPHIIGELYRVVTLLRIRDAGGWSMELNRKLSTGSKAMMNILLDAFELWNTNLPDEDEAFESKDVDDRHLMTAAIRAKAAYIVSNNTIVFPAANINERHMLHGVEYIRAQDFLAMIAAQEEEAGGSTA